MVEFGSSHQYHSISVPAAKHSASPLLGIALMAAAAYAGMAALFARGFHHTKCPPPPPPPLPHLFIVPVQSERLLRLGHGLTQPVLSGPR